MSDLDEIDDSFSNSHGVTTEQTMTPWDWEWKTKYDLMKKKVYVTPWEADVWFGPNWETMYRAITMSTGREQGHYHEPWPLSCSSAILQLLVLSPCTQWRVWTKSITGLERINGKPVSRFSGFTPTLGWWSCFFNGIGWNKSTLCKYYWIYYIPIAWNGDCQLISQR